MGKRGPKNKFEATPEKLAEIEELAGLGFTQEQMHNLFGISHDTWYKEVKKTPEITERIKKGKAKNLKIVSNKLLELVNKNNLGAIIFYLKSQYGWSETPALVQESDSEKQKTKALPIPTDPIEAAKVYRSIMTGG